MHLVLDSTYVPKDDVAKAAFEEMQIFMYAVMAEHLKMDKGKSLVSQYEKDHDAQSIYHDLKKHALGSTSAWLSGEALLKYINTARYPGTWCVTASAFMLHWKEQVKQYETLEVEDFPPKQKLHMIQNAIGDVTELAHVKQLADLGVANGNKALTYDSYSALLLNACATFDTRHELPGRQKRAVYATAIAGNEVDEPYDPYDDKGYKAYLVDTTISEIMVNAADSNQFSGKSGNGSQGSGRIPYSEWFKTTKEEQDAVFAKRNQESMAKAGGNLNPCPPPRRANMHDIEAYVDFDVIVDYAVSKHEVDFNDSDDGNKDNDNGTELLAYMAGQKSSCGDVHQVLASNQTTDKQKKRQVNEGTSAPSMVTIDGTTY
jgi:hypothetical protein